MRLEGKVAVITGGSEGIGLATAQLFREEGASVVICGRRQEKLDEAAKLLGEACLAVQCDISSVADIERLYAASSERFGKIDVLVANASTFKFMPLAQMTEEFFDETVAVNLKGTYFTVQRAMEHLNDGASVVLVGSVAQYLGGAGSPYALTKAGINQMVRSFSQALIARGIRVNVLSPGVVDTPIYDKTGMPAEVAAAAAENRASMPALGRPAAAEEIAKCILFLASDDSSYVLGTELIADGGIVGFRPPPPAARTE